MPGFPNGASRHHALRPSETDLVEIQVGMLRADMMKNPGDGTADAGVEALHRIDVDGVANILTTGMFHGLVNRLLGSLGVPFAQARGFVTPNLKRALTSKQSNGDGLRRSQPVSNPHKSYRSPYGRDTKGTGWTWLPGGRICRPLDRKREIRRTTTNLQSGKTLAYLPVSHR